MIELRKITYDNFNQVIDLEVNETQKEFVASNIYSLAEAYVALTSNVTTPLPFGIYAEERLVGFLMLSYDTKNPDEEDDEDVYWIWRFMIAKSEQQKGYGKAAMLKALEYIRTFPLGEATAIVLSYEPSNEVVRKLYASLGFFETGEINDGEVVAKYDLTKLG